MPTISEAVDHEAIAEMPRQRLPATTIGVKASSSTSSFNKHTPNASQAKTPSRKASNDATHDVECLACGCHYTCVDDLANHQRAQHGLAEIIL